MKLYLYLVSCPNAVALVFFFSNYRQNIFIIYTRMHVFSGLKRDNGRRLSNNYFAKTLFYLKLNIILSRDMVVLSTAFAHPAYFKIKFIFSLVNRILEITIYNVQRSPETAVNLHTYCYIYIHIYLCECVFYYQWKCNFSKINNASTRWNRRTRVCFKSNRTIMTELICTRSYQFL